MHSEGIRIQTEERRGEEVKQIGLGDKRSKGLASGSSFCQTRDLVSSKAGASMTISLIYGANYPLLQVHTNTRRHLLSHMHILKLLEYTRLNITHVQTY